MEQKQNYLIYGRGYVPTHLISWLNDYNINDFEWTASGMKFTGTQKELSDLVKLLMKDETTFKVDGYHCFSDINVHLSNNGQTIQIIDDTNQITHQVSPETAFEIFSNAVYYHTKFSFKSFLMHLGWPDNPEIKKSFYFAIRQSTFDSILKKSAK